MKNYIGEAVQKLAIAEYQLEVHEKCRKMIDDYGDDWDESMVDRLQIQGLQQQGFSQFYSTTAV